MNLTCLKTAVGVVLSLSTILGCDLTPTKLNGNHDDRPAWRQNRGEEFVVCRPKEGDWCNRNERLALPANFQWKGWKDRNFTYDHCFTWGGYGEVNPKLGEFVRDTEQAVYAFDHVQVGQGRRGWNEIMKRLESLPKGSRIVMHPDRDQQVPGVPNPFGFPFNYKELARVIVQADLILIVLQRYEVANTDKNAAYGD